jgi:hypothetical protein
MAKRITETLFTEELILKDVEPKVLAAEIERIITEELMVEDRLNDEVRELLRGHESSIDRGGYDYRRLFELTKQKLVRERGIII